METPERAIFDAVYAKLSADQVPWHYDEPPPELLALVDGRPPCKAVELGCGLGSQCIALARLGFQVTGLDCSHVAILRARALVEQAGLNVIFAVADLVTPLEGLDTDFQLAWDWEVLHHVFPAQREQFAQNVASLLASGGLYYSVSFSTEDPFADAKRTRKTPLGTELYFSTEEEVAAAFSPSFEILSLRTQRVRGKHGPHMANVALMAKR